GSREQRSTAEWTNGRVEAPDRLVHSSIRPLVHSSIRPLLHSSTRPTKESPMPPVRLGYVGCGFMAQKVHLPNFATIPGCELVALAEVRGDLREKVADRFRIPRRYGHHLEMARDAEIDAVALSAGYALQAEMAADFLRRGKP